MSIQPRRHSWTTIIVFMVLALLAMPAAITIAAALTRCRGLNVSQYRWS